MTNKKTCLPASLSTSRNGTAKQTKILLLSILLFSAIFLTGCVKFGIKEKDGGVFRSTDKADTWEQKVIISKTEKETIAIDGVEVLNMVFDPQDSQTIYLGTLKNGMFVTRDGAETWQPTPIKKAAISAIAVDSKDSKNIFVSIENKIFKTIDGGERWTLIYTENRPEKYLTDLAVDSYDHKKVYAGVSNGELIRSLDAGESWSMVYNFKNKIEKILINKKDTRIVYVGTQNKGLFKTIDLGKTWTDLSENMKKYPSSKKFQGLVQDLTKTDAIIHASAHGLLKSDNGGQGWQDIKLLTAVGKLQIHSLAVNPKNSDEIYYGTALAIYKSKDGGKSWITKPLPSSQAAVNLLIDPNDPKTIYLGVRRIQEAKDNPFDF